MRSIGRAFVVAVAVAVLSAPLTVPPARAQATSIVPGIVVGVLVEQLSVRIHEAIERAERAGNFVLAQALRQMLTMLDAFKATADDLLTKTFDSLTDQQQLFFREIDSVIANATLTANDVLEKTTRIAELGYQITNDLPLIGKGRQVILRYAPSTLVWDRGQQVAVEFRGLNIADATPVLVIGERRIEAQTLLLQSATFAVPTDLVPRPTNRPRTMKATVELTRKRRFWPDDVTRQPVTFTVIPEILGRYFAITPYKHPVREWSMVYTYTMKFSGRNETVKHVQTPVTGADWRIEPASITYHKYSGEASDELTLADPTPTGFILAMPCREYIHGVYKYPGYGHATWSWQEYRMTEAVSAPLPGFGFLRVGETRFVPLPPTMTTIEGAFEDFQGNVYQLTGAMTKNVVEARVNGNLLTLEAKISQTSEPRPGAPPYNPGPLDMLEEVRTGDFRNAERLIDAVVARAQVVAVPATGEDAFHGIDGSDAESVSARRENFVLHGDAMQYSLKKLRDLQADPTASPLQIQEREQHMLRRFHGVEFPQEESWLALATKILAAPAP